MRTRIAVVGCLIALWLGAADSSWMPLGATSVTASNFSDALNAYMKSRVEADTFSGAVLVTERYRPLFSFASGWADRERGYLNRLDTRFNVGSIGKSFTAVAILQLAEQGRLSLTDTIGQHLPNYPRPAADKVTIHHLLTHRSGLPPSFINDRFWALKNFFATEQGLPAALHRSAARLRARHAEPLQQSGIRGTRRHHRKRVG